MSNKLPVCKHCSGKGFIRETMFGEDGAHGYEYTRWASCSDCEGLGVIDERKNKREQIAYLVARLKGLKCDRKKLDSRIKELATTIQRLRSRK